MTPQELARLRRTLTGRLIEALVRLFTGLDSWWIDEDVERFVSQAVPLVQGTQQALASLTAVYIATQASEATRTAVAPPGIPNRDVIGLRRGVTPQQVYRRPFTELYTALSRGDEVPVALDKAQTRLQQVAEADLQQTYARSSRATMQQLPPKARPSGWRRVLTGEENCAMCVVASTQRYTIEELNPIHPACDCTVVPLYGQYEQVIEPELLEQVHTAVEGLTGEQDRGARAPDYRQIMTRMTPEHGELGTMLVRSRDEFTGPQGIPAA